ncbi:uncharacterized protein LOC144061724 [Vanacampus margaritifer]
MEAEQKWTVAGGTSQKLQKNNSEKLKWDNWRQFSSVTVCIALSLLSVGICIGVFVRTTALQSRIVSLEQQHFSAWMLSLEQVEPVILDRLDQILDKKLAARLPKTREVREAPYSCLCPPGMFPILWLCLKKLKEVQPTWLLPVITRRTLCPHECHTFNSWHCLVTERAELRCLDGDGILNE